VDQDPDQFKADNCLRKAQEYRAKVLAATDQRLKGALTAVAWEYEARAGKAKKV